MRKNTVKLLIDVILVGIFVFLFNIQVFGLSFHESLGIGIGLGILVHFFLNRQWVKKVSLRLFDHKLPLKTRLGYALNLLLFITFMLIIVTGLYISKVIFANIHVGNVAAIRTLHVSLSYLALLLVGIHIGLHWKWIMGFSKNAAKAKFSKPAGTAAQLLILILLFAGGYQLAASNFVNQIAGIGSIFSMTQSANMPEGFQQQLPGINKTPKNSQQRTSGAGFGLANSTAQGSVGRFRSTNLLNVIGLVEYLGIISIFAIMVYYLEKFLTSVWY